MVVVINFISENNCCLNVHGKLFFVFIFVCLLSFQSVNLSLYDQGQGHDRQSFDIIHHLPYSK